MTSTRKRIAIIGSGISGLASAYFLRHQHDVVLFEANDYLGGHTHTVDVTLEGRTHGVDTGFLVYNDHTYPNLVALFAELGVASIASDMSFGVSMDGGALEWAGTSIDTVFAQRANALSPSFLGMLRDIVHFNGHAQRFLELAGATGLTLGQLLRRERYGARFRDAYLLPMAAAIWSSSPNDILRFPAATFLRFCLNHRLLQVNNRPQWRTVAGGARQYVEKIAATLPDRRLRTAVHSVRREGGAVLVSSSMGTETFDAVVLATHAPTTLAMLADASETERAILGGVRYQPNTAWLHTDTQLMPRRRKVWSAWNYLAGAASAGQRPVCVSYWLNQLQALPFDTPVMVTLNPHVPPAAGTVLDKFDYAHPIMDQATIRSQQQLAQIQGKGGLWYAGAWTGYGFHEDGLKSALRVAAAFDAAPAWATLP
ncbi:NAD(P)/FAD-dependent oxidoreductase [Janthinobacterium psychrotolerans]|uniref:Putative NAD/FAD-binding protein n=1 Tax=Janthinobacterium psychrotolerans TaxID=1747903 RepID=A0A1A7BWN3_9BURK|nr:FAD-dependent oxidoreductase [Janthinobacterium psychrotolerans]OBV37996.1 putative NAD/FAD-binding protein [Janthinobacterium psychrotolerans]